MPDDIATFDLSPIMKLEDCQRLHTFLQDAQASNVVINCAAVTRLGGMAAQTLQMAANAWPARGFSFQLDAPTDGCRDSLQTLDMAALLTTKGTAA